MRELKRFVVINDNMLGCVDPRQPDQAQILASSVVRGAPSDPLLGVFPIRFNRNTRPATRADFETYRVCSRGYRADPDYDFPTT